MAEPFDMNPIIKLWMIITNNSLLCQHLNEYMKLTKIRIISMFGLVENERIFSILAFIKNKLCNQLGTFGYNYLHVCTRVLTQENFPYHEAITCWEEQKMQINVLT
jgi:hypothetical protein